MTQSSVIQEIKDRLDVVTVIGRYTPLKKAGSSYKGLCPFHSEKTPSFHVFPETGTWKCFGCSAGGDIFSFVEKKENLPFSDVLRILAQEAGVQLHEQRPEVRDAKEKLRKIHAIATSRFQSQLLTSAEGKRAREYLARRGVSQETIEHFQLGYASDGWEHLITHLKDKGFSLDAIIQAGLAIQRDTGGAYDRFRNRLIIPISDLQGRVIAFGGRILDSGEPKYLNSPQTPLFDKSQVVFGLNFAKRAIRAKDQVVLVEGYMDVISAHQNGFKNVVAAMGTSITPQQIKLISRYTRNFVFAMDADEAGARAAWRGVQMVQEALSARGVLTPSSRGFKTEKRMLATINIAIMPAGKDPDDVLREEPDLWASLIENAIPVVDYTIQRIAKENDLSTAAGKSQFVHDLLPALSKIGDVIQRRHYIGKVASMIKALDSDIEESLRQFERAERRYSASSRTHKPKSLSSPPLHKPPHHLAPPSDATLISSDEEPPLWPSATSTAHPSSDQSQAASTSSPFSIGTEEHLLANLLYHYQKVLPWLDDELAQLELSPIYGEDFQDPVNRAIFDLLDDFRFDATDQTNLDEFMSNQDALIYDKFLLLWEYAGYMESKKPKNIQFHHFQKDIITSLIRLRADKLRKIQREVTILQKDALPKDEKERMAKEVLVLTNERNKLKAAVWKFSQSGRIANTRRF